MSFFKLQSTWTVPIPAGHPLMGNSAEYVHYLNSVSPGLDVSFRGWSVPVWYADSATPRFNFQVVSPSAGVQQAIAANGWNLNVPVPDNALPAGWAEFQAGEYRDLHMVVIEGNNEWDFFGLYTPLGPNKVTDRVKRYDLAGNGIDQPYTGASCRVSPVPLTQGLVTKAEMDAGVIPHAIAFATENIKQDSPGVYPCVTSNNGQSLDQWAPWLGFRFRLNPSVQISTLNLTPVGLIYAKALQDYGMILVDKSGAGPHALYAEDRDNQFPAWGIGFNLSGIPLNLFDLVEPVYAATAPIPDPVPVPAPEPIPPPIFFPRRRLYRRRMEDR